MITSNIKLLYSKNRYIFAILIVMQVVIVCSMLYIVSKINGRTYLLNNYAEDITTFTVDSEDIFSDEMDNYVDKLNDISKDIDTVSMIIGTEYNCASYALNEKMVTENHYSDFGVNKFNYDLWSSNSNILLSVENMYAHKTSYEVVNIYNEEYKVTGTADRYAAKFSIIPYSIIKTKHIPLSQIRIKYKSINGINDMQNKYAEIITVFHGCKINEPLKRNYIKEEIFRNDNVIEIILSVLSVISEMYLYMFLIKSTIREYAIYELCGAKKKEILRISLIVLGLIFGFCYLSGVVIFKLFLLKIIAKAEPIIQSVSSIYCYLSVLILLLVSIAFMSIPVYKQVSGYQIVSVIKDGEEK